MVPEASPLSKADSEPAVPSEPFKVTVEVELEQAARNKNEAVNNLGNFIESSQSLGEMTNHCHGASGRCQCRGLLIHSAQELIVRLRL